MRFANGGKGVSIVIGHSSHQSRWYNANWRVGKRTHDREVLNRKAFWWSEFTPERRSVAERCLELPFLRVFCDLIRLEHVASFLHELSLTRPLTVFAPVDRGFEHRMSLVDELIREPLRLQRFLRAHVVQGRWLMRDLVGSDYTPWETYNTPREPPSRLSTLSEERLLEVDVRGNLKDFNRRIYLTSVRVDLDQQGAAAAIDIERETGKDVGGVVLPHRYDLKAHNGVVHCVDVPVVPIRRKKLLAV